jgi:hypothetical protein
MSRISAFLRAKSYTQRYDKTRALSTPAFVQPIRSHESWQIDDQGVEFYKGVKAHFLFLIPRRRSCLISVIS